VIYITFLTRKLLVLFRGVHFNRNALKRITVMGK